jgi:S-formylglutathione hydrolase
MRRFMANRSSVARGLLAVLVVAHATPAQHGRIVTDTLRSASLANLLGAPAQARVSVYLPPRYDTDTRTRYPVLYLLHGAGSSDAEWTGVAPDRGMRGRDIRGLMDSLIAKGAAKEMIVVMPDASNRFKVGSFYVNSITTGNWEDFMTRDLVAHVDSMYRTLTRPESRGIAGVSMGGYGAFYLSMRHGGDTYGAMYAMSACCSPPPTFDPASDGAMWDAINALPSFAALEQAGVMARITVARSAAVAPDSTKPPFFFEPTEERHGGPLQVNPAVVAKWNAHSTLLMVASSRARLLRMRGIHFEVGAQDEAVPPHELMSMDSAFAQAGIPHTFELFEGTHTSRITERLATKLLPFFSRTLVFDAASR